MFAVERFSGQQHLTQELGIPRGRGGVVEVCECACSRDRMTTFDLCSPWCKASRITSCKVTVWTAAHACLCLSTQGGTQFLKEALQYLSLQLALQSIALCIYKYTILKTMTKVTFCWKNIFCIWIIKTENLSALCWSSKSHVKASRSTLHKEKPTDPTRAAWSDSGQEKLPRRKKPRADLWLWRAAICSDQWRKRNIETRIQSEWQTSEKH